MGFLGLARWLTGNEILLPAWGFEFKPLDLHGIRKKSDSCELSLDLYLATYTQE